MRPLTRSCFLLLFLGRLLLLAVPVLLGICFSFTMESTFSTPCSRYDPHLSRQGAALAHLDSLPLMVWCFGQTALFLFLLAKAAPAYLPTAFSVALRPLFSAGPVYSSFSVEACAILHALCWSRQH